MAGHARTIGVLTPCSDDDDDARFCSTWIAFIATLRPKRLSLRNISWQKGALEILIKALIG